MVADLVALGVGVGRAGCRVGVVVDVEHGGDLVGRTGHGAAVEGAGHGVEQSADLELAGGLVEDLEHVHVGEGDGGVVVHAEARDVGVGLARILHRRAVLVLGDAVVELRAVRQATLADLLEEGRAPRQAVGLAAAARGGGHVTGRVAVNLEGLVARAIAVLVEGLVAKRPVLGEVVHRVRRGAELVTKADGVTDLVLKRGALHLAADPLPELDAERLLVVRKVGVGGEELRAVLGELVGEANHVRVPGAVHEAEALHAVLALTLAHAAADGLERAKVDGRLEAIDCGLLVGREGLAGLARDVGGAGKLLELGKLGALLHGRAAEHLEGLGLHRALGAEELGLLLEDRLDAGPVQNLKVGALGTLELLDVLVDLALEVVEVLGLALVLEVAEVGVGRELFTEVGEVFLRGLRKADILGLKLAKQNLQEFVDPVGRLVVVRAVEVGVAADDLRGERIRCARAVAAPGERGLVVDPVDVAVAKVADQLLLAGLLADAALVTLHGGLDGLLEKLRLARVLGLCHPTVQRGLELGKRAEARVHAEVEHAADLLGRLALGCSHGARKDGAPLLGRLEGVVDERHRHFGVEVVGERLRLALRHRLHRPVRVAVGLEDFPVVGQQHLRRVAATVEAVVDATLGPEEAELQHVVLVILTGNVVVGRVDLAERRTDLDGLGAAIGTVVRVAEVGDALDPGRGADVGGDDVEVDDIVVLERAVDGVAVLVRALGPEGDLLAGVLRGDGDVAHHLDAREGVRLRRDLVVRPVHAEVLTLIPRTVRAVLRDRVGTLARRGVVVTLDVEPLADAEAHHRLTVLGREARHALLAGRDADDIFVGPLADEAVFGELELDLLHLAFEALEGGVGGRVGIYHRLAEVPFALEHLLRKLVGLRPVDVAGDLSTSGEVGHANQHHAQFTHPNSTRHALLLSRWRQAPRRLFEMFRNVEGSRF